MYKSYIKVIYMKTVCVNLDQRSLDLLRDYSKKETISRSAALRIIVKKFLLKEEVLQ